MTTDDAMPRRRSTRRLLWALGASLLICLLAVYFLHRRQTRRVEQARQQQQEQVDRGPRVFVAPVEVTPLAREVTMPAEVRAFNQATLYAKLSGYLTLINVDKGDTATEGQILAVVKSPETDHDVANARADLRTKELFAERMRQLLKQKLVATQAYDDARALADSAREVLKRELALQAYEIIRAPFSGTVTGRYVDPGALVSAGTGSTSAAQPIVDLVDDTHVRVQVFVGQDVASFISEKTEVVVRLDERPDKPIQSHLSLVSGALDPRSRTMLAEVWLDNDHRQLQPGSFVHVTLKVQVPPVPVVPSNGLFIRGNSNLAAVVSENRLHFVTVQPGLDDGTHVQIVSGLKPGQLIALNVSADLADGDAVQPVQRSAEGRPAR